MPSQVKHIIIDCGSNFSKNFLVLDDSGIASNITSTTFSARYKKTFTSNTSYSFTISKDVANSIVAISLNDTETKNTPAGTYVYVIERTDGSITKRLYEGIATFTPTV